MSSKKSCVIHGGRPVKGEITCYGAKNFATKAMIGALLGQGTTFLENAPQIGDVAITADMLRSIGVVVHHEGAHMSLDTTTMTASEVRKSSLGTNRMPVLLLAALLHRFESVSVPSMGGCLQAAPVASKSGCVLGGRFLDFHYNAMVAFGADVEDNGQTMTASRKGRLVATHINLPYPSVGATETCLFLACLAKGRSFISNVATEPEIMALVTMLNLMGAQIYPGPNRTLTIDGVESLKGTRMAILGDRIEAASMACLACASNGDIVVHGIQPETMINFLPHFQRIGGGVELVTADSMRFFRKGPIRTTTLETDVYPGFSTDWQQPFAVLLTQAEGISLIHETVYENRFGYLATINQFGARTEVSTQCLGSSTCRYKDKGHPHSAMIVGATRFIAPKNSVEVPDLRAGLAYIVAAAIAEGTTTLTNLALLERGYGDIVSRLANLNLDIMSPNSVQPILKAKALHTKPQEILA